MQFFCYLFICCSWKLLFICIFLKHIMIVMTNIYHKRGILPTCLFLCREFSVFLHLALEMVYDNIFCISRSNIMRQHPLLCVYIYMHASNQNCAYCPFNGDNLLIHVLKCICDLSKTLQLFIFHRFLPSIVGSTSSEQTESLSWYMLKVLLSTSFFQAWISA